MNDWQGIEGTWQKQFPINGLGELTVIIGEGQNFADNLSFKERVPEGSAEEDRPGTRLDDWLDSLTPDAIIEIIAKRDRYRGDVSETTSNS